MNLPANDVDRLIYGKPDAMFWMEMYLLKTFHSTRSRSLNLLFPDAVIGIKCTCPCGT